MNAMDPLAALAVVALAMASLAALPYLIVEGRWRWRWQEIERGRVAVDGAAGVYRSGGEVPRYLVEAPRLVRVAAYSCFLFGQMFVPGLVMGMFGMVAAGIGLVSIPGLITAAKVYRAGLALLRRQPRVAYFRARDAAAWALWLNGIALGGSFLLMATPLRPMSHSAWGIMAFVDGYGVASILQALLLRRAARLHEDALFAATAQPSA